MTEEQRIDDLITMLDSFMGNGGGHMNVQVSDTENISEVAVETFNSVICNNNMACSVPTLHKDIDDEI